LLVEDVRFRGGFMVQKSFSLKWSNVCSFTLGRFDEVEEFLPEMNKITINTDGAQNLLQHLKPNKATGPTTSQLSSLKKLA
jgi:hypothetical protein